MNVVVPFGFYGWGNIGDESTLQGFARLVSHHGNGLRVSVASRDPGHTSRVEPSFRYFHAVNRDLRRRWAHFRSDAAVVAGGTPIMDILGRWPLSELIPLMQSVHDHGKPIGFVGSGVETLHREESRRLVREILAPIVRHWTVRSSWDRDRLLEYGVAGNRVSIAADLAWTLSPAKSDFGEMYIRSLGVPEGARCVGVNLTNETFVEAQAPAIFKEIARFLDTLIERDDAYVLFLANEVRLGSTFDTAASRRVLSEMALADRAVLVPNRYWSPQEMLSLIACCELTVTMRYHFCLFSALEGVPFIAIARSDKVADLCRDLAWPHTLPLEAVDTAKLVDLYGDLQARRATLLPWLDRQVHTFKERAWKNRLALDALTVNG